MSTRSKKKLARDIMNNPITLAKEQWESVANELLDAGPIIQDSLRRAKANNADKQEFYQLHPGINPETFEADIRLACTAIIYVANFATDKCRLVVMEESKNVQ